MLVGYRLNKRRYRDTTKVRIVIGYVPKAIRRGDVTVTNIRHASWSRCVVAVLLCAMLLMAPEITFAQESPFLTGAESLQSNILAWATPIAVILVMVLGFMAMSNRISWGWPIGAIIGIAVIFGAPQIVTWIRGMFAV
jgi:type IV secretion system protein VirB2